jgi:DNA-binding XRE family transcriptional regulator
MGHRRVKRKLQNSDQAGGRPWGERIKAARALLGMETQAKLAQALGVTQPTVSDWERGDYAPSPDYALKLGNLVAPISQDDARWFWQESGLKPELSEAYERERGYALRVAELKSQIKECEKAAQAADPRSSAFLAGELDGLSGQVALADKQRRREAARVLVLERIETVKHAYDSLVSLERRRFEVLRRIHFPEVQIAPAIEGLGQRFGDIARTRRRLAEEKTKGSGPHPNAEFEERTIQRLREEAVAAEAGLRRLLHYFDSVLLEGEEPPATWRTYEVMYNLQAKVAGRPATLRRGQKLKFHPSDDDLWRLRRSGAVREVLDDAKDDKGPDEVK